MKTLALILTTAATSISTLLPPAKKADTYKVDTEKSSITWIGRKVTGQHEGTLKLASGELVAEGKSVKSGNFVIDMKSLANTDLEGETREKLLGHLRSDDFFSVEKNPTATFTVTKITPAGANKINVTGNLTIKGKTAPVSFPATVTVSGNTLTAKATGVKVDRTKYDIKYGSKTFFESIGDKAISDEFELAINLVSSK